MEISSIIAIIAVLLSALGIAWTYFGGILAIRKEIVEIADKVRIQAARDNKQLSNIIVDQGNRLTKMETKMELFWNAVGGAMSSLIKQPIHFRKDELMDKLVGEKLPESTTEELVELREILQDELIALREIKDPKSLAYALAIAYIEQLLYDRGYHGGRA